MIPLVVFRQPRSLRRRIGHLLLAGSSWVLPACSDAPLDGNAWQPDGGIERDAGPSAPGVGGAQPLLADEQTTIAEFTGVADPSTGLLRISILPLDLATDPALRRLRQGVCEMNVVQDGVPGSGPADSIELVTERTGYNESCFGYFASPLFCGDVTVRSFYGTLKPQVFAQILTQAPSTGYSVQNGDVIPGSSSGLGSWAYGDLGPAPGPDNANTRPWVFANAGGRFTFTGRVVMNVVESCDGVDNDCDGIVDEGGGCRLTGQPCTMAADCATGLSCAGGFCGAGSCAAGEHLSAGVCLSDTRSCTLPNAAAAAQVWDGAAWGACVAESCNPGFHLATGACDSDTRACTLPNATTASDTYLDGFWSGCIAATCNAGFHLAGGLCANDTRACTLPSGAAGLERWSAGAWGPCEEPSCPTGFHLSSGLCFSDVESCSAPNAAGAVRVWDGAGFGPCLPQTCVPLFHLTADTCVSDKQSCLLPLATVAEQTWDGSGFGACLPVVCIGGFHVEGTDCVSDTRFCSAPHGFGTETFAGGAWGVCRPDSCDPDYHLEAGACAPNLRGCSIANGIGSQTWLGSAYGSCTAEQCGTGYHVEAGLCASNTRPCFVEGGDGIETWDGAANYGACFATSCQLGFTLHLGNCVLARCGNGLVENAEYCDDGNAINDDSCSNRCVCGFGFHFEAGLCQPDIRDCYVGDALGYEAWNGNGYDACISLACGPLAYPSGTVCLPKLELGALCSANGQCLSNFCATAPLGTANDRCAPTGMNWIPPGTFIMGSPSSEVGRGTDETQHQVTISRPFFLGAEELSQSAWKALAGGTNPSCTQSLTSGSYECTTLSSNDASPVERVDWFAALAYANDRSAREGLPACYTLSNCTDGAAGWKDGQHSGCTAATFAGLTCTGYRLPTEAEWEYASRATAKTAYFWGETASSTDLWMATGSGGRTHPSGTIAAPRVRNNFGLADVSGNVSEWVWDRFGSVTATVVTDPLGAASDVRRIFRGGSWSLDASRARSASRYGITPVYRNSDLGFRIARTAVLPQTVTCPAGYHSNGTFCDVDVLACSVAHATAASQTWQGSGFDTCTVSSCETGYSLVANRCEVVCGDGVIGGAETCDDGNSVTEVCNYGTTSCTVCDATCTLVAGATAFCGDGTLQNGEFCDDGNTINEDACSNSCVCGAGYHIENGQCMSDIQDCLAPLGVGLDGLLPLAPGTKTWNGAAYDDCVLSVCICP